MTCAKINQAIVQFFTFAFPLTNIVLLYIFTYHIPLSKYEEEDLNFILFYTLIDIGLQFLITYNYIYIIVMIICAIFLTITIKSYLDYRFWIDCYFMGYLSFSMYKYSYLKFKDIKKIK
jgi:hypothetical protein